MTKAIAALLLGLFSFFSACQHKAEAQTLKIAVPVPEGTVWMRTMRKVADSVHQRTNRRVRLKFYPGGVMGSDQVVLRKMRIGQLHGGMVLAGAMAQIYPDIQLYSQPMLFRSYEEVAYVRSQIDPQLIRALAQRHFLTFGMAEGGFVYLMSKNPLRRIEDLSREKVWVGQGDVISQTFFEAAGLSPVPLQVSDVYTGLQTGLIRTVGSPPVAAIALQWHTQLKYLTDVPLLYVYGMLVLDSRVFSKLRAGDRAIVRELLSQATNNINARTRQDNVSARQALQRAGMIFIKPSSEELERIRRVAIEARASLRRQGIFSVTLLEALKRHLSKVRNR